MTTTMFLIPRFGKPLNRNRSNSASSYGSSDAGRCARTSSHISRPRCVGVACAVVPTSAGTAKESSAS